ncbi:hypothetical protein ACN47E_009905 [Coniothyrium glycines]
MPITTNKQTSSASCSNPESAKRWLQKQIRKTTSRQVLKRTDDDSHAQAQVSTARPRTAPQPNEAAPATTITPAISPVVINVECASPSPHPPPRPARPASGVMRDVNAWLDASMTTSSPPLMGGITYWRAADNPGLRDFPYVQHAIPLSAARDLGRPATSHSQGTKSFRRCAKKIHVQMPTLLRSRSRRSAGQKNANRKSASMPVLAIPYEQTMQGPPPELLTRYGSRARPATATRTGRGDERLLSTGQVSLERLPLGRGTPTTSRTVETESTFERRINAFFVRSGRSADNTRPSTAAAGLQREGSVGDFSDAPTYFSGLPPPSYKSRAASILTTSSFGCIDGMSSAQREISHQRAAERRSMKGKLREFARTLAK